MAERLAQFVASAQAASQWTLDALRVPARHRRNAGIALGVLAGALLGALLWTIAAMLATVALVLGAVLGGWLGHRAQTRPLAKRRR